MRELVLALRQLRRSPGFTLVAVLTLALGIGASTTVFTVVDRVLLKPLEYRDSGQLVTLWENIFVANHIGPNLRHVDIWKQQARSFAQFASVDQATGGLQVGTGHPIPVTYLYASPNLLDVLRVTPSLGRDLQAGDGVKGRDHVALVSARLAAQLFGSPQAALGSTVRLAQQPVQIIGLLPEGFHFPKPSVLRAFQEAQLSGIPEAQLIVPRVDNLSELSWDGDYGNHVTLARLRAGVTLRQAQNELTSLQQEVRRTIQANRKNSEGPPVTATLEPLHLSLVSDSRRAIWLLAAAVGTLLLIGCINLANAQLSRAIARERDSAVRSALGASASALLLSGLAESLLLACMGGLGGLVLAEGVLGIFRSSAPLDVPRAYEIKLNFEVFLFAFGVTLLASLLSGALPAIAAVRTNTLRALNRGGVRAGTSKSTRRLRQVLIAAQVLGSTALLLITALFGRSLQELLEHARPFGTKQVAVAEVDLNGVAKPARFAFKRGVLAELQRLPDIAQAGMLSAMPLGGDRWIESLEPVDMPGRNNPLANQRWASPGALEALGLRIVEGRDLRESDGNDHNAVVSEAAARAAWPGRHALGQKFRVQDKTYTVAGIVKDERVNSLKSAPPITIYAPYQDDRSGETIFVARTRHGSAEALLDPLRTAIWGYNRDAAITQVKTLNEQMNDSLATERFQASLLAFFGASALLLAGLGIFGLLSYAVSTRRREFGIRMALGATRMRIYSLTGSEVLLPVLAGLAGGWAVSAGMSQYLASLLYGTKTVDGSLFFLVATVLLLAALAAAFAPAREAARVDPAEALRAE